MMKFTPQKIATLLVLTASLGGGLSACAPMIVGGAVMGSFVATDRRTTGTQVEDEGIELRSANRLRDNLGERAHINVTSFNRQVLLTGEAATAKDKALAEQVVSKVENVRAIVNEIGLAGNASLSQRTNDTITTGRVKAGLVDTKDLFANAFKVVTDRGTVYLMGRVTQREANRATDIARSTPGALKVVRVLEIITEEELQDLMPKPAAPVEVKK
jgi:osmotically-inducible protein OsmY